MRKLNAPGRVTLTFPKGEGRTEQAHVGDVDINQIWAKALIGQKSDYIKEYGGRYGDATSLDFLQANILISNAQEMFDALPSEIRSRFQNQPGKFMDFVQDPENEQELIKLKLANPKPEDDSPDKPITPPAPIVDPPDLPEIKK